MDFSRITFLTFLNEAIKERTRFETQELKFTRDSGMLAAMKELFEEVSENGEHTIHLKD